jgi:hypothetical protein
MKIILSEEEVKQAISRYLKDYEILHIKLRRRLSKTEELGSVEIETKVPEHE